MFFPADILARKGKFGLVWLAATGSSDKSKLLSKRDYIQVNIQKSCYEIIYPAIPFALRLSSHLMLGVSRIFGKQTKFALDETTHIWMRVHDVLAASTRSIDLANPTARYELITLQEPGQIDMMNYAIEPFRLDILPHPTSLHVSDSNYLDVMKHTMFLSPSSSSVKSSSSEMITSPYQAHKRDITLPDDIFPTNVQIEVPGEVDFGPILSEDPMDIQMGVQDLPPMSQMEEVSDVPENIVDEHVIKELKLDEVLEQMPLPGIDTVMIEEPAAVERQQVATGNKEKADGTPAEEISWHEVSSTPRGDVQLFSRTPLRPRKRRHQAIDGDIALTSKEIRSNLACPDASLKVLYIGGPHMVSANELLSQPSISYLANDYVTEIWRHNARTIPDPSLHTTMNDESDMGSPELLLRRANETPLSVETLRRGTEMSLEFERSAASTVTIDATPLEESEMFQSGETEEVLPRYRSRGAVSELPTLSPIADEFQDDLAVPLEDIGEVQYASDSEQDEIPSPKQEEFLSKLAGYLANVESILFSEIAPPRITKRKTAAKAFSYLLALNARQAVEVEQKRAFGEIVIRAGHAL
eukprot:gene17046-18763_t